MRQDGSIPDFEVLEVESAISGNYDLVNSSFFSFLSSYHMCAIIISYGFISQKHCEKRICACTNRQCKCTECIAGCYSMLS